MGACLMIGGDRNCSSGSSRSSPMLLSRRLSLLRGVGAGHFVKMIHNGIEYGMMQAIARVPDHASGRSTSISSRSRMSTSTQRDRIRLIGWLCEAFGLHGDALEDVSGIVGHTAKARGPWMRRRTSSRGRVIADALQFRIESEHNQPMRGRS